jgi:hypothetical protein
MIIEWIRRQGPEFHHELETYLFKEKDITKIEEE